ncbi:MAG: hypothetical protein V4498_05095 [candidate division FCPU426 bacterium]
MKKIITLIAFLAAFAPAQVLNLQKGGHWNIVFVDTSTNTQYTSPFYTVAISVTNSSVLSDLKPTFYGKATSPSTDHYSINFWATKALRNAGDTSNSIFGARNFSSLGASATLSFLEQHSSGISATAQFDRGIDIGSYPSLDLVELTLMGSLPNNTVGSGSSVVVANYTTGTSDTNVFRNGPTFSGNARDLGTHRIDSTLDLRGPFNWTGRTGPTDGPLYLQDNEVHPVSEIPISNIVDPTNRDGTHYLSGDGAWKTIPVSGADSASIKSLIHDSNSVQLPNYLLKVRYTDSIAAFIARVNTWAATQNFAAANFSGNVSFGGSGATFPVEIQTDGSAHGLKIIGRGDNTGRIIFKANDGSTTNGTIQVDDDGLHLGARASNATDALITPGGAFQMTGKISTPDTMTATKVRADSGQFGGVSASRGIKVPYINPEGDTTRFPRRGIKIANTYFYADSITGAFHIANLFSSGVDLTLDGLFTTGDFIANTSVSFVLDSTIRNIYAPNEEGVYGTVPNGGGSGAWAWWSKTPGDTMVTTRDAGASGGHVLLTLTGCDATTQDSGSWTKVGKIVSLTIPALFCTSNSISATITGFPSDIAPINNPIYSMTTMVQNNGVNENGQLQITDGSSTINIFHSTISLITGGFAAPSSAWTSSGGKGNYQTTWTYSVDNAGGGG